ncbi:hypothetical protein [Streptomyces sp. RTd22]|uniref:hypothetical protein n=1 Tax=Streptomyces sp. RTd22 TaxID=1841249 RepID=UPI0007C5C633|nr:hypothetical protein [Streptomyces sp. RTd22]
MFTSQMDQLADTGNVPPGRRGGAVSRFAVTNTRVFTGTHVAVASVVIVEDGTIAAVGHEVPDGVEEFDGGGGPCCRA